MPKRLRIGAICCEPFYERTGEVVRGIIAQAFTCKCDVVLLNALYSHMHERNRHRTNERSIFRLIMSDSFDGFIYDRRFFYNDELCTYIEELLINSKKPVMMVDDCEHKLFDNTASDDRRPFEKLIDHLIEVHGHRHIFCLTGPEDSTPAQERLKGYFDSMNRHGLEYDDSYYRYGDFWKQSAVDLAADILQNRIPMPDAVACGNDITAETLISHLVSGGLRVPEDIAVVGFDCMDGRLFSGVDLTSYRRANFQLGADSMRRLFRIITGNVAPRTNYDTEGLCLGSSCGCRRTMESRSGRSKDILRQFEHEMLNSDIYMECTQMPDTDTALKKACEFAFYLHRFSLFRVCLISSKVPSAFAGNTLNADSTVTKMVTRLSSGETKTEVTSFKAADIIPELNRPHSRPMALFVNMLNSIGNEFGYTVLSFGKNICSFSESYQRYIYEIKNVLEYFRNISAYSRQIGYRTDPFTELPVISVYEEAFAEMDSPAVISIEIKDMRKLYLGNTTDKFTNIMKQFTVFLRSLLKEGESPVYVTHGSYALITDDPSRTEAVYQALCTADISDLFGQDVQFAVGSYAAGSGCGHNLYESARNAMMNIRLTVSGKSKSKDNPLFEKLCSIRERMAASPQTDWNIDGICSELHVSKSYLQKYYKSHFGVSIIENLIQLRLDMAKELLADTDMSITAIADKCGYSSYIHFTKQFRKYENTTPTEYRREKRNK